MTGPVFADRRQISVLQLMKRSTGNLADDVALLREDAVKLEQMIENLKFKGEHWVHLMLLLITGK